MQDIYKLGLHDDAYIEDFDLESTRAIRVPGGWVYIFTKCSGQDEDAPITMSSTFVPFDNEFQGDGTDPLGDMFNGPEFPSTTRV